MALIKTNYGLRYNDDGSLCMTIRQDDVPFPGVDSWAVEEGTTNLLQLSTINVVNGSGDWVTPYSDAAVVVDSSYSYTFTRNVVNDDGVGIVLKANVAAETTYTLSFTIDWVINQDYTRGIYIRFYDSSGNIINENTSSYYHESVKYSISQDDFQEGYITYTFETPANTTSVKFYIGTGGANVPSGVSLILTKPQLEQKTYATSFVDGTRDDGKFKLTPALPADNFVINFWYKSTRSLQAYHDQSAQSNNGKILQGNSYAINPSFTYWIYSTTVGNPYLRILGNYQSGSGWELASVVLPENEVSILFDTFTMHTIIFDNLSYKIYVNNELKASGTYTTPMDISFLDMKYANGLISNFYTGHYRDKNGNVIWTDDYIKYVYEQKKPFITPPTMPLE